MSGNTNSGSTWRMAAWTLAALLLLTPYIAMQFTGEVNWAAFDFAVAAALLLGVGVPFELVVRKASNMAYRAAAGVALMAAFLLAWLSLGVGIIGKDGDPANLMYFGVIVAGVIGTIIARFEAAGMANALFATALAQATVAAIALIGRLGYPWSGPLEILALNGFFVALFVGSALLFLNAART